MVKFLKANEATAAAKSSGQENEDKMNSMRDKLEDLESELAAARKKVLTMIKYYSVSTCNMYFHITLEQFYHESFTSLKQTFKLYYIGSYYLQMKQSELC